MKDETKNQDFVQSINKPEEKKPVLVSCLFWFVLLAIIITIGVYFGGTVGNIWHVITKPY
jgi:hypothetical protein